MPYADMIKLVPDFNIHIYYHDSQIIPNIITCPNVCTISTLVLLVMCNCYSVINVSDFMQSIPAYIAHESESSAGVGKLFIWRTILEIML